MGGVKFQTSASTALNPYAEAILFAPDIVSFTKRGWTRCAELSAAAVQDKSKANGFNKAVAAIQLFWFFSQLFGRLATSIVISPLEWFTLAYVVCAFAMYAFWWDKPFDAQTPLVMYPDPSLPAGKTSTMEACVFTQQHRLGTSHVLHGTLRPHWSDTDMIGENNEVSLLWISSSTPMAIAMAISTVLSGACHLCGWNYPFPTTLESSMWRSASIFCVCIPLIVLARRSYPIGLKKRLGRRVVAALVLIYLIGRFFLLFEVFFALRSAPPQIYKAVPWAQHIPHI